MKPRIFKLANKSQREDQRIFPPKIQEGEFLLWSPPLIFFPGKLFQGETGDYTPPAPIA